MKCRTFKECYAKGTPFCDDKDCYIYKKGKYGSISSGEGAKKIIFRNPQNRKTVSMYCVDGKGNRDGIICGTVDGERRCDELLIVYDDNRAIFIEYKGRDYLHGLTQIENSVDDLKQELAGFTIHGRYINGGGVPRALGGKTVALRTKLRKLGGEFIPKTNQLEEII